MTQERITLVDGTESWKLTADEGMALIRIADEIDFGSEVTLGYRYRNAGGELLDEPVLEVPSDFREEHAEINEDDYAEFEEV